MRSTILAAAVVLLSLSAGSALAQTYDHVEPTPNPDGPYAPTTGFVAGMPRGDARVRDDLTVQAMHRDAETRDWEARRTGDGANQWATGMLSVPRPGVSASNVTLAISRIEAKAARQGRALTSAEEARIERLRRRLGEAQGGSRS